MKTTILFFACFLLLAVRSNGQTVTDYDGNVYDTVTIGTQVWLRENLKVTHFRNGDAIHNITDSIEWVLTTSPGRCDYHNNPDNSIIYGILYNYYVGADSRGLCPTDWHVPGEDDWLKLVTYLGGYPVGGGAMKEAGTTHWIGPNNFATNSSGFTALPAGVNSGLAIFSGQGNYASFWGAEPTSPTGAHCWFLMDAYGTITRSNYSDQNGFSIRCILDYPTGIGSVKNSDGISISPNPATDRITITFPFPGGEELSLVNLTGQCVLQQVLRSGKTEVDVSTLAKGIYIVKITGSKGTYEKKLIRE